MKQRYYYAIGTWTRILVFAAALHGAGCAAAPGPRLVEESPTSPAAVASDPAHNWAMPPAELERRLGHDEFEIRSMKGAGGGVTGASKATLFFPADGKELRVKLKVVPTGLDGWNNSPRKELAAYAIQKWFLEPQDYVVPTSAARCIAIEMLQPFLGTLEPTVAGSRCVVVILSVWLDNATVPERLYDPERASADSQYARRMQEFNLLTHLIGHRDGRDGNFLVSTDSRDRRVFAVDNGIAFSPLVYNYFVPNWDLIRVPTLPRALVGRLEQVRVHDLESLGVLVELHQEANGMLEVVEPGANLSPRFGVRRAPGILQLGLRMREIEDVAFTIFELLTLLSDATPRP